MVVIISIYHIPYRRKGKSSGVFVLPSLAEKRLEDFAGLVFQQARLDFHLMEHAAESCDIESGTGGSHARIRTGKNKLAETRVDHRSRAHGAWLFCHKQCAIVQPPIAFGG